MAKKDDWITCQECESEFRVISDNHDPVLNCPFCGYELDEEDLDDDLEDYD